MTPIIRKFDKPGVFASNNPMPDMIEFVHTFNSAVGTIQACLQEGDRGSGRKLSEVETAIRGERR